MTSNQPIFIGGAPRSGTTLLASILGAHPDCVATHPTPWKFRGEYPLAPDVVEVTNRMGARWVDHTSQNLRHMPLLLARYPGARFVHIVRDGRAVASSIMPLDFGPNTPIRAAHWWIEQVAYGLAAERWWTAQVHRVYYEDLVQVPDRVLTGLCRRLDLDYDERMLGADGYELQPWSRDQHALIGRPVTEARAYSWMGELTQRQWELFESEAGDMLRLMGYGLLPSKPRGPSVAERARMAVQERVKAAVNSQRKRHRRRSV